MIDPGATLRFCAAWHLCAAAFLFAWARSHAVAADPAPPYRRRLYRAYLDAVALAAAAPGPLAEARVRRAERRLAELEGAGRGG